MKDRTLGGRHRGGTTWTGGLKCREVKTGFCRNISMQTGFSGTLIGRKSCQTTFVPLWDRMEGAWLSAKMSCLAAYQLYILQETMQAIETKNIASCNLITRETCEQWWAKWRISTFDLYPWGKGHGVQGQICDNLRLQLAMNHFLPLWPNRFLHFGFIHLGGGGGGGLWYYIDVEHST